MCHVGDFEEGQLGKTIAIIGGGPAGLMAAEILSAKGAAVTIYERKATAGRKFLMAGRGGLNLTHSEDITTFIEKYGVQAPLLGPVVRAYTPQMLRDWCEGLGEITFVGTSGRVFPKRFKASPLLRAWIGRLEAQGVQFAMNHDWLGWDDDALLFKTADGNLRVKADATLLALGGASWPRLGADGTWVEILAQAGVDVALLLPANCGFHVAWSPLFSAKFAGQPLKAVNATFKGKSIIGDIMMTAQGIEGGAIYALSSVLRDAITLEGPVTLQIDLKPDLGLAAVIERLSRPRGRESVANHLRKSLGLSPVAIGLLMENPDRQNFSTYPPLRMAQLIKQHTLRLDAPFDIARAISSAGGVKFTSVDAHFMLIKKPGVFVAGEMMDWEAPTGGYLLQGTFATAVQAAQGIEDFLFG